MPHFVTAVVHDVVEERPGLQKVTVDRDEAKKPEYAYVLTRLIGPVSVGDAVIVNVTAVDLKLGTGGWHFVHWNLSRGEFHEPGPGHVMKLRYTSLQIDAGSVEETQYAAPSSLNDMPVIGCLLLSQVAAVAAAFKFQQGDKRLVLVMHDQNALPIVLSDLVYELQTKGLIDATITAGQAFGGDFEAVNTMSAYGVAKVKAAADAVIVANGHGSVGTGTPLGFSALPLASALDDALGYGGKPILCLRWSDADQRDRHRGLSHHSQTVMDRALSLILPAPTTSATAAYHDRHKTERVDVPDIQELFAKWDLDVTSMGRTYADDPAFFRYAAAAGTFAAQTL